MFNTVADKKIAVLGFAFKAGTGDTREAPAIDICRLLFEERANLVISDPKAIKNAKNDLCFAGDKISYEEDPYKACENADAVLVLTEGEEYKNLNYKKIFDSMNRPSFIFDGRNILDHNKLYEMGFNVYPIGKEEQTHLKRDKL